MTVLMMAQGGKNLMQAISIASLRMPDALQLDKLLNQTVERRLLQKKTNNYNKMKNNNWKRM